MAIFDFETESAPSQVFDYVVIGAGAAGIFLADGLSSAGSSVCLLETGGWSEADEYQALNDLEQTGKRQANCLWNRKRNLGGTTTAWGGQSLPFSRLDFASKSWLPGVEWPIKYDEISRHYIKVNRFMSIDEKNYKTDIEPLVQCFDPGFDSSLVSFHFSKWAPQPNFIKLKRSSLQGRVTVLFHAHVVRFIWSTPSSLGGVEVAALSGKRAVVKGRSVILANGGIESVRTLLIAFGQKEDRQHSALRWLGYGFMDHPTLDLGTIETGDSLRLQRQFATHRYRRWKYSVRLSAAEDWLERHSFPNISASILFIPDSSRDWLNVVKGLLVRPLVGGCLDLFRVLPDVVLGLYYLLLRGFVFRRSARPRLSVMAEQPPSAESYIGLSDQLDQFGLPKARLHWTIDDSVVQLIRSFALVLKSELERIGFGKVILNKELFADDAKVKDSLGDVNHHMGGARMSADSSAGVVDPWMRVWGVENLYVCSSSVFVTSSHSNPTLTLLALCSRLLERLTKK
jgi:choline dehydrogenase-like flavoprotein